MRGETDARRSAAEERRREHTERYERRIAEARERAADHERTNRDAARALRESFR
jgi:hypothetical protein